MSTESTTPSDTPSNTAPVAPAPASPRLRVGTVVWGLVIATVGIGLLALAAGATIDVQLAFIVLLGAAGLALLGGSLVAGLRHRDR
ncbi:hypothetical protein AGMMS50218_01770 [Actinomycetota bacterium]|nr:hypothetical protein AGMMS50218_01770 [Actinomycetota bacterium]